MTANYGHSFPPGTLVVGLPMVGAGLSCNPEVEPSSRMWKKL